MSSAERSSHKKRKAKCKDAATITPYKTPNDAIVDAAKPRMAKKMKSISPPDVLTAILNMRRDKALVNLDDNGTVLRFIRDPFFDEKAKGYHQNDMKKPKHNFQVQYQKKPKVEKGKSARLAALTSAAPQPESALSTEINIKPSNTVSEWFETHVFWQTSESGETFLPL
jgi:hypothetical protein